VKMEGCNLPSSQCQRAAAAIVLQIANRFEKSGLASAALLSGRAPYRESFDFLDASMFDKRS